MLTFNSISPKIKHKEERISWNRYKKTLKLLGIVKELLKNIITVELLLIVVKVLELVIESL